MLNTIIFFFALLFTVFFFSNLVIWAVFKIAPQNFKKEFTNRNVLDANISMFVALILWSVLYHL
jgi:hypothetical protein